MSSNTSEDYANKIIKVGKDLKISILDKLVEEYEVEYRKFAEKRMLRIVSHKYRFREPRFKCQWVEDQPDSILSVDEIMWFPEQLGEYLRFMGNRAFDKLLYRAPYLWNTMTFYYGHKYYKNCK